MSSSFQQLLPVLANGEVRFIIIGGVASIAHGAARATYDIDVVYARDPDNIERLVESLQPYQPYLRDAPSGLPFTWDERTISAGLNFTLSTALGPLDLLGEVAGGGFYNDLVPFSDELDVFKIKCRVVGLEKLIQLKRAAGRPKDFEAIAELQALLDERRR